MQSALDTFRNYIARNKLKLTRQREVILRSFLEAEGHVSAEELYQTVSAENPSIGLATVYRTLNLLVECGLAQRRQFGEVRHRYEHVLEHEHHDHLVCVSCGKIEEFECESIEVSQREIADQFGFRLLHHRHELYGHCRACSDKSGA